MADQIERLIAEQGWTDESVRILLMEFIEDRNLRAALFEHLSNVAELENEFTEEDEDAVEEDEDDG